MSDPQVGFKPGFERREGGLASPLDPDKGAETAPLDPHQQRRRRHHGAPKRPRNRCSFLDPLPLVQLVLDGRDGKRPHKNSGKPLHVLRELVLAVTSTLYGMVLCLTESYLLNPKTASGLVYMWVVPSVMLIALYYPLKAAADVIVFTQTGRDRSDDPELEKEIAAIGIVNCALHILFIAISILYLYVMAQTILFFVDQSTPEGIGILWAIPIVLTALVLVVGD